MLHARGIIRPFNFSLFQLGHVSCHKVVAERYSGSELLVLGQRRILLEGPRYHSAHASRVRLTSAIAEHISSCLLPNV